MSEPLRIGIDIRPLSGTSGRRGVGSYLRGLLGGMISQLDADREVILLFGSGTECTDGILSGMERVRLTRPRRAITLWDQAAWPPLLLRRRVGVFHSPFYAIPYLRPRGCRIVQTVHDLTPLKFKGVVSPRNERIFRTNFWLARRADRIVVPSRATGEDVISMLGVPERAVVIIPEACDIDDTDIAQGERCLPGLMERLGIPREGRFIVHTGGHDRVKNLPQLLDAFAILLRQGRDLDLVVTGEHGPETPALIARAASMEILERVRFPGFVSRSELVGLYRGAAALVYPSLAEGFGLPVIEAMTCSTPVVVSDAGALPEVAGEAAVYVRDRSAGSLAVAIGTILDDPERAAHLSGRARERARSFSWKETARRTLEVYREVAA